MSRIRGKDTTPEKAVRSMLLRMGYRFRLNVKIPIELGKQEAGKLTCSLRTGAKAPAVLISNSAVRMNSHGHDILFDSDGVLVFALAV